MPTITILAGPNGVGKTRLSDHLVKVCILPTKPVNLDLLFNEVIDQSVHDSYLDSKIPSRVDALFGELCKEAISKKKDFSFECNLRVNQLKYILLFEKASYDIHLVYMYLHDIETSKQRVRDRFINEKASPISEEKIAENFYEGLENLDKYYHNFQSILLLDNNSHMCNPVIQVNIKNGVVVYKNDNFPPESLSPYLTNISNL